MQSKKPLLVLIEDDAPLQKHLRALLAGAGYNVELAEAGAKGLELARSHKPAIIMLDLGLPDIDGQQLLLILRKEMDVPIVVLSARDDPVEKITALDNGADDYLTKPFSFRELLARIHALLRRDSQLRPDVLEIGDLVLDSISHRVSRAHHEVQLTAKEYALLEYLARRAGQLVSRAEIAAHVWDDTFDPFSNTIEVYMNRLRKKIDGKHTIKLLHTRRGEGYMLDVRH